MTSFDLRHGRRRRVGTAVATAAAALAVTASASGHDSDGSHPANARTAGAGAVAASTHNVYRVEMAARVNGEIEHRVEWVNVATGAWRFRDAGQTHVYDGGRRYEIIHPDGSRYLRVGSSRYLGLLADKSVALRPLQQRLAHAPQLPARAGAEVLTFRFSTPSGTTVAARAQLRTDRAIVPARSDGATTVPANYEAELTVGEAPSLPVLPYWFGQRAPDGRIARAAAEVRWMPTPDDRKLGETSRSEEPALHLTFYEVPGDFDTHAYPGGYPVSEVQVASSPVTSGRARASLEAYSGGRSDNAWPQTRITLANGERATLVTFRFDGDTFPGFAVVTARTLVTVTGRFESADAVRSLASALRPL